MTSNQKNIAIMAGVFLPVVAASYAYLKLAGHTDETLRMLLRITARAAFMLFLVIFAARPLRQLVRTDLTKWLVKERRSLGIAFAMVHIAHLTLIACRFSSIPALEYPPSSAAGGGLAYLFVLLMLITSFNAPARAIGPKAWKAVHKVGLYYIFAIFIFTLLPEVGEPVYTWERAWFTMLTGLAIFIRLTAFFAKRKKPTA